MSCLLLFAGLLTAPDTSLPRIELFSLPDLKGQKHTAADWKGKKAVVLLFLGLECPVSNGYAPEYARLAKTFAGEGIGFYGIHADPIVTPASATKHAREYRLSFPILLDARQQVARQAGVTIVPQAVVLAPAGQVLYRGRIDDRYSLDGKRREEPSIRDLENALKAIVAGKAPAVAETKVFGCPLAAPSN